MWSAQLIVQPGGNVGKHFLPVGLHQQFGNETGLSKEDADDYANDIMICFATLILYFDSVF